MSDCRVYHIALDGGVHLVTEEENEREAHTIADGLQELCDQGALPETFYMCAPCGSSSDVSWMRKSLRPTNGKSTVDYMAVYQASIEERQSKMRGEKSSGRRSRKSAPRHS